MVTFAEYFKKNLTEAKFREVAVDLEEVAQKCVKLYVKKYQSKSQKQIEAKTFPTSVSAAWTKYFDNPNITRFSRPEKFEVTDLATNNKKSISFVVAFGEHEGVLGYYDNANDLLIFFAHEAKDLSSSEMLTTLVHELTHGVQQYRTQSEEYEEQVKKMLKGEEYDPHIYHMEPIELDATLTEIAYTIKKEFKSRIEDIKKSKQEATKRVMKNRLEKFLLELKVFIKAGIDTYFKYDELPVPVFLSSHEEFLKTLNEHPTEWKKLKQRLVDLYAKFEKEQQQISEFHTD